MEALVDHLPASLQALTISLENLSDDDIEDLFEGWVVSKDDKLPHLGQINYARLEKIPDQVKEAIEATGVGLFHRDRFVPVIHQS